MKKAKKIFSVLTAVLVLVTMSSAFSFAEDVDNVSNADGTQVQEQAADTETPTNGENTSDSNDNQVKDNHRVIKLEAGDKAITASWDNIEGAGIEDYEFKLNGQTSVFVPQIGGSVTTVTFADLENGTEYSVTVLFKDEVIGSEKAVPAEKLQVTGLSGNRSIKLKWAGDVNTAYVIQRSISGANNFTTIENAVVRSEEEGVVSFEDKNLDRYIDSKNVNRYRTYDYTVEVKNAPASKSDIVKKTPVRSAYVQVYTKTSKTLYNYVNGKSQKGKKGAVKISLPKYTKVQTCGFGGGKYDFYYNPSKKTFADGRVDPNDSKVSGYYHFRLMGVSTVRSGSRAPSTDYAGAKTENYTKEEAEYYINNTPSSVKSSSTSKLIWVNKYHQHLYLFKKAANGTWTCFDDWEVSTGKATTPSPDGTKSIIGFKYNRHGIHYWSRFSSWNALHGVHSKSVKGKGIVPWNDKSHHGSEWLSKLGTPQSGGCIRNPIGKAQYIYSNCKKSTRVRVY